MQSFRIPHYTNTHLFRKMSCNTTRCQLILVSWSLRDTWKRLLLNLIISWRSLKKNSTSKVFIFLKHLTSTFKILWYLWRKNKMFKALRFIFSVRRWIWYMFISGLSCIKEVFHWVSSDTCGKDCGSLWPGLGESLCFFTGQESCVLFCLLRQMGVLTHLCILKTWFLDKHNTNASEPIPVIISNSDITLYFKP